MNMNPALFQLLCASKDCKKNIIPAVTYIACTVSQCAKGEIISEKKKIRGFDVNSFGSILAISSHYSEIIECTTFYASSINMTYIHNIVRYKIVNLLVRIIFLGFSIFPDASFQGATNPRRFFDVLSPPLGRGFRNHVSLLIVLDIKPLLLIFD